MNDRWIGPLIFAVASVAVSVAWVLAQSTAPPRPRVSLLPPSEKSKPAPVVPIDLSPVYRKARSSVIAAADSALPAAAVSGEFGLTTLKLPEVCGDIIVPDIPPAATLDHEELVEWWSSALSERGRRATLVAQPLASGPEIWGVLFQCHKSQIVAVVDFTTEAKLLVSEKVREEYCCGEWGMDVRSFRASDLDGDGRTEFELTGNEQSSGGTDFRRFGEAVLYVFPNRRVEVTGDIQPRDSFETTLDGNRVIVTQGTPNYWPGTKPGKHTFGFLRQGALEDMRFVASVDTPEQTVGYPFCRHVRTKKEVSEFEGHLVWEFRQRVDAPSKGCADIMYDGAAHDFSRTNTLEIGMAAKTVIFEPDRIHVKVRRNLHEARDLK